MIEASGQARSADDQPTHWLVSLYRAVRPREGYVVVALAVAAVICLPTAAVAGGLIVGLGATPGLAVAALLVAWWLAHRRLRGWLAAPVLALAGVCAVLVWGVYVLRPWSLFLPGVRWLTWWLREHVASAPLRAVTQAPPLDAFAAQGSALARFGQRLAWWVEGLVTGAGVPDNLVLVALVCLLAWGLAAWAGWWLARHGKPLVALLPSFVLLIIQVYWAPNGIWTLLLFLGVLTLLLVLVRLAREMAVWERAGCRLLTGNQARHSDRRTCGRDAGGDTGSRPAVSHLQRSVDGLLAACWKARIAASSSASVPASPACVPAAH